MADLRPARELIREALALLGVERLVLGVHDASFPGDEDEDPGRGTPYSRGAERFCAFAAALGFDGLQLGPQGMTHAGSASPYEATLFSRNPLNLPLSRLRDEGVLPAELAERLVAARPEHALARMDYPHVHALFRQVTDALHLRAPVAFVEENAWWLLPDALYEPLCRTHGAAWYRDWRSAEDRELFLRPDPQTRLGQLRALFSEDVERYAAVQFLLELQHQTFRERLRALGLGLYGDLQVGLSAQDEWARAPLMVSGYAMGAPPSRTNPDGQPWGYPVPNPALMGTLQAPGPALAFVMARLRRVAAAYDGLRLDHPHGWIDPWVYRTDAAAEDLLFEVQNGARLRSSPAAPGHEALAPFAIARPEQLRTDRPRHADDYVAALDTAQVDAYAAQVDALLLAAKEAQLSERAVVCEVLSTLPYPVKRVMERHGLGRFRVLQKAKVEDDADVYRPENAEPPDWVMLGNHDTLPIWRVVQQWRDDGRRALWAEHLSRRFAGQRGMDAQTLREDDSALVHALFAEALGSRARNVFVFFTDLFGQTDPYNVPGTISPDNWTLRVPPDYPNQLALDLPRALALALRRLPGQRARSLSDALRAARP